MKYHFVCRFAPEVSTTDIENSVSDQLKLCWLTCTRLKKHSKLTLHFMLVTEEDLPQLKIREFGPTAVWLLRFMGG
jgi:hypothetical protein